METPSGQQSRSRTGQLHGRQVREADAVVLRAAESASQVRTVIRQQHDHRRAFRIRDQPVDRLPDAPVDENELIHVGSPVLPEPLLELKLVGQIRAPQYAAIAIEEIGMVRRDEVRDDELGPRFPRQPG